MILALEVKKLKRTGYFAAFFLGALLAAAFPLANMLVRPEVFTALPGEPFSILLDANWQMMAMVNILLAVCGACIMYHTEYDDGALEKMAGLPVSPGSMFLGKFLIMAGAVALMLIIETAALTLCTLHWFPAYSFDPAAILSCFGFQFTAALPTVMLALLIASLCRNMWISLGIGVILVFAMTVLPQGNPVIALFPFSAPYQTPDAVRENGQTALFVAVCCAQTLGLGVLEWIIQNIRRRFA